MNLPPTLRHSDPDHSFVEDLRRSLPSSALPLPPFPSNTLPVPLASPDLLILWPSPTPDHNSRSLQSNPTWISPSFLPLGREDGSPPSPPSSSPPRGTGVGW